MENHALQKILQHTSTNKYDLALRQKRGPIIQYVKNNITYDSSFNLRSIGGLQIILDACNIWEYTKTQHFTNKKWNIFDNNLASLK